MVTSTIEADTVDDSVFSRDVAGHTVVHHWNRNSVYRPSSLCGQGTHRPWPESTDVCCWHCTEPFDGSPIGIPLQIKADGRVVCDGNFCSYSCALTHIFDSGSSHREFRTKQLLTQVARELHGIVDIVPAPPRLSLRKFGGPLSVDEFRQAATLHKLVVNPPFVSQDVVYEEMRDDTGTAAAPAPAAAAPPAAAPPGPSAITLQAHNTDERTDQWSVRGLRPPSAPLAEAEVLTDSGPLGANMFTDFVAAQGRTVAAPPPQDAAFGGELNRFLSKKV